VAPKNHGGGKNWGKESQTTLKGNLGLGKLGKKKKKKGRQLHFCGKKKSFCWGGGFVC